MAEDGDYPGIVDEDRRMVLCNHYPGLSAKPVDP